MTDNAAEEPIETPVNKPPENPPGEMIPEKENEPVILPTETENMEVHHHAQHGEKKNWKSYAWEFLMLFFAVFFGFLAQNFLEHRLENEKGIQYVKSMIEDIISDSVKINHTLEFSEKQQLGLDSLSQLFDHPPYSDSTIKRMYILMLKYTMNDANVALTKRTISQLNNSGGMRLISSKISADEITKYAEGADDIETQGNFFKDVALNEIIKLNNQIFYLKYINGVTRRNIDSIMVKAPIPLANKDKNLLIEYANRLLFTSGALMNYNYKLTNFKAEIPKTIAILKKENNIE